MPRFFLPREECRSTILLTGEHARHIAKSLRMKAGEEVVVCDGQGSDYRCVIDSIDSEQAALRCLEVLPTRSEPTLRVTLCQGLPKSDKMESIIQKAVELGVHHILPFISSRTVVRPDSKGSEKRLTRWNRIALEAAKQSGRGIIPEVAAPVTFARLLEQTAQTPKILFFESGGEPLRPLLQHIQGNLVIMIGPEGGFSFEEVATVQQTGGHVATLGPRILRTETAPIVALSAVMLESGNLE